MSKFTLQIKLKQHTPIIHFESLQEATIRATELKPKLDRFLIEKAKSEKKDHKNLDYKPWKKSKDHNALNYKVKVIVNGSVKRDVIRGKTLYFGNLGKNKKTEGVYKPEYSFVSGKDAIVLEFFSFNVGLLGFIEEHFGEFIFKTNFGTRQNKGFGSFFIEDDEDEDVLTRLDSLATGCYYLLIKGTKEDVYKDIKYYYERLKSGINFKNEYQNSFLKKYISNNGSRWEKPWLKKTFLDVEIKPNTKSDKNCFARAFLGLPGDFTFTMKNKRKISITVNSKENKIERFASPITFKPIELSKDNWRVYILTKHIPDELCDHPFKFKCEGKSDTLSTPSKKINIDDLLEKYHIDLEEFKRKGKKLNIKKS
jgi:hypothetical protein